MSYLQQVVQTAPNEYTLPKIGASMGCPVVAFLSPELFAQTDETIWQQAVNAASYPTAKGVYLMPDTHAGYHVPVGCVLVTENVVAQAASGYDISCGMIALRVPGLRAADVADPAKRKAWIEAVEQRVATGLGDHQPPKMRKASYKDVSEVFLYGAVPLKVNPDLCERPYLPVDTNWFNPNRIQKAAAKAIPQLGSLGGGNHFIEMMVDPADSSVWVMVHTGSRGYGWQTAEHYFHAVAEHRGINRNRREESWVWMDEDLGREFWAHHNSAANYAIANRWTIVQGVSAATEEVFQATPKGVYEISHNLSQVETVWLPDGSKQTGIVHRKGATRALPAHHPDLWNTRWYESGHPVLIPGSMLAGAAILTPLDGARRSGGSVNHGSGRLMGRGEAKRELGALQDDIDAEMRENRIECADGTVVVGIAQNNERTPLDECGHVYKPLDKVLGVLVDEGIARIEHRMLPVASIKGME